MNNVIYLAERRGGGQREKGSEKTPPKDLGRRKVTASSPWWVPVGLIAVGLIGSAFLVVAITFLQDFFHTEPTPPTTVIYSCAAKVGCPGKIDRPEAPDDDLGIRFDKL